MEIYIREANIEDAEAISQVGGQSFRDTFGWQFVGYEDDLDAYVEKTYALDKIKTGLENENNVFWLAFEGEKPVGFAKLKVKSTYSKIKNKHSQLQKIYVLHESLGTGAGKLLMNALEEKWTNLETKYLWLLVEINNERAIRFYSRKGYAKKSRTDFVIGKQIFEFELMEKKKVFS